MSESTDCKQRDCNIYLYREEISDLGPTKTRDLILHCRLWGPSGNKGTVFGIALHPPDCKEGIRGIHFKNEIKI